MLAKVKPDYRWNTIRACAGAEFVKSEWRPVPVGRENEARAAGLLIKDEPDTAVEMVVRDAAVTDLAPTKLPRKRGK